MVGKRVQFDEETWVAVDMLARESRRDFQDLADEAFRDLLAKHGQPVGLKDQLKGSLKQDRTGRDESAPAPRRAKAHARMRSYR